MSARRDAWASVQDFTYRSSGVVLEDERRYLMKSRLERVALHLGFSSVEEFVHRACAPGAAPLLTAPLLDAMTTHETSFFRDPSFWRLLGDQILPTLIRGRNRPLNIWSAACSSGQEAVSLAILLQERYPLVFAVSKIVATDVACQTVARARTGVYSLLEVNRGLPADRLIRHFEPVPGGFRPARALRDRIVFMVHNLLGDPPYPTGFDLVLCRNVLIYFNESDRSTVLRRLASSATPGYLGLGATELLAGQSSVGAGWYALAAGKRGVL
jgi:chemotaxis protein methyltransferase CheR